MSPSTDKHKKLTDKFNLKAKLNLALIDIMTSSIKNKKFVLASHPQGPVIPENFKLVEEDLPALGDDEVLIRHQWLSLDPYMRGRISPAKSYAQGVKVGDTMVGATVGVIEQSKSDKFQIGDVVLSATGWQLYGVAKASQVMKVDASKVPSSAFVGVLGMPGITAWTGLMNICEPKPGETVVVDAASGAVGAVVGQLAKIAGCRVVGIAGGAAKCEYVVKELGFDACVDHRSKTFAQDVADALPAGIDCLFENVGGAIFELLLSKMNAFSRIALCGTVSEYNDDPYPNRALRSILINRIKFQGFIVSDKLDTWPGIREKLTELVIAGKLKFRESIAEGLEQAPRAFVGMLAGENFGKQLVRISN